MKKTLVIAFIAAAIMSANSITYLNTIKANASEEIVQQDIQQPKTYGNISKMWSMSTGSGYVLLWNKADDERITGYNIYKKKADTYELISNVNSDITNHYIGAVSSVGANTYAIKAVYNENGEEHLSDDYTQTDIIIAPEKISGFKAASSGSSSAKLSWNKSAEATGYIVYEKNAAGNWVEKAVINNDSTTSYTATGLTPGKEYSFAIKGYITINDEKVVSAAFSSASVKTGLSADRYSYTQLECSK